MTGQPAHTAVPSDARRAEPRRLRVVGGGVSGAPRGVGVREELAELLARVRRRLGAVDAASLEEALAEYADLLDGGGVPPLPVLDAIAGALGMDEEERIYLGHLARRTVRPRTPGLPRRPQR